MRLQEYLAKKNIKMAAWGRACGVATRATARRYVLGDQIPPHDVVVRTFLWSGGQVAPNDFYDLPALPESGASEREAA